MRLLLVEDDATFASHLRRRLEEDGIVVDVATTLAAGLVAIGQGGFAAVLLDLDLPDGNGVAILRRLRAANHTVPVMVISGSADEETIIGLLDCGADDFVVKPSSLRLLRARIRTLIRRGTSAPSESMRCGKLVVDTRQREAWADGRMLQLSVLEFNLLAHFVQTPGEVHSRASLMERVWGSEGEPGSNVVDVTIGRIRKRLGNDAGVPEIESVRTVGYVMRAPMAAAM